MENLKKEIELLILFLLSVDLMYDLKIYSKSEDFKLRVNVQVYDYKDHKCKNFELSGIDKTYPSDSIKKNKTFKKQIEGALKK